MTADLFSGLVKPNEKPACQKGDDSTARCASDAVGDAERVVDCELCVGDSPIYDFGLVCCRARFILSVPMLEVRRGWIERWKRKDSEMCAAVEREVRMRWRGIN